MWFYNNNNQREQHTGHHNHQAREREHNQAMHERELESRRVVNELFNHPHKPEPVIVREEQPIVREVVHEDQTDEINLPEESAYHAPYR